MGVPRDGPTKNVPKKWESQGSWAISSAVSFLLSLQGSPRADIDCGILAWSSCVDSGGPNGFSPRGALVGVSGC